jgi:uncharacterized protein YqeY
MKINELIKAVTKDYMPIAKRVAEAKRNGDKLSDEEAKEYFELSNTLEFYKIIKGMFMEEVTKNKNMTHSIIDAGLLTTHTEQAEKDGKKVDVDVVDQSMDERIDLVPESVYQPIFEKMVKSHLENIEAFKKRGDNESLAKEELELNILNSWLPKETTKEDVEQYLNEYYPSGIEKKSMGLVIKEVKNAFDRVDGKMVSQCVMAKII